MNKERYDALMDGKDTLRMDEIRQGWHFCPDWDYLLISPEDTEFDGCSCDDFHLDQTESGENYDLPFTD